MPTIEVSKETYEKIKDQLVDADFEVSSYDDFIGKKLFIRTVTYHMVGKVKSRVGNLLELENASWIADSGRFSDAIKKGELDEVEPVGTAFVSMSAVVDIFPWKHELPIKQK